jgi:hypothetical protein
MEVLLSTGMTIIIEEWYFFWSIKPHSPVEVHQYIGGIYCLHLQDNPSKKPLRSKQQALLVAGFLQEAELGSIELDGITSQKVVLFIVTDVENLRSSHNYCLCVDTGICHKS